MREPDSIHDRVLRLGYTHECEMLEDLYEDNWLSVREIAGIVGIPFSSVKFRLEANGFALRARGGPNHTVEA